MNKAFLEEFKELQKVALNLMQCSNDKCAETQKAIMKDKAIFNDILDVAFQKDINKKSDLMTRLYKNKIIMENSKCIFNNCKDIYKQLLKILIEKLKKLPIPEDFKKKAIKLMQKNKKLITKTKMTNKDIAELAKNFDLALLNLL